MNKIYLLTGLAAVSLSLSSCRTLNPAATDVALLDKPPDNCSKVGIVNVDWSWWRTSTESLNVLRNKTHDKGGNAMFPNGENLATAYKCPETAK